MPVLDGNFEAFVTNLGKYNEGALVGEWVKSVSYTHLFDDEGYEEEPYVNEDEEPDIADDDEETEDEEV